jgi:hypothetical protein
MTQCVRSQRWFLVGLLGAAVAGCGGETSPTEGTGGAMESVALNELAEAYRAYSIAKKVPPKKVADLASLEALGANGVAAMRQGDIIVQWGAELTDLGEEPGKVASQDVLAYWKTVPEQGGYVLMLDRTVKKMTAEEFQPAPKAKGDPSSSLNLGDKAKAKAK